MKTKIIFVGLLVLISVYSIAQFGKTVTNVKLVDVNDVVKNIPYIGNKVFTVFYVDPDVQDIVDPLSDALNARKFPKNKFGAIGMANCKDTWIPNSAIIYKAHQKQEQYPESLILLDKSYILQKAWGLGSCDNVAVIIVVGKDSKIKYIKTIKSQEEAKVLISTLLKIIDSELK